MKNTIESVNQEVSNLGWKLITEEYKNLDTEMEFMCPEGHKVYTTLKRFRARQECPVIVYVDYFSHFKSSPFSVCLGVVLRLCVKNSPE